MSSVIDIIGSLIFFAGLSFGPAMLLSIFDDDLLEFEDMFFVSWMVSVVLNTILFLNGGY
jgi:hypothetical protein